jgi:hypothetical protein
MIGIGGSVIVTRDHPMLRFINGAVDLSNVRRSAIVTCSRSRHRAFHGHKAATLLDFKRFKTTMKVNP